MDARLAAFDALKDQGPGASQVLWRSRGKTTAKHLAKALLATKDDEGAAKSLLRAFDFQAKGDDRDTALLEVFDKGSPQVRAAVVFQMPADLLINSPERMIKVRGLVKQLEGKSDLVRLATHLDLSDVDDQLHDYILMNPGSNESVQAARTLLRRVDDLETVLMKSAAPAFSHLANAVGKTGESSAVKLLAAHALDEEKDPAARVILAKALAQSNRGEKRAV